MVKAKRSSHLKAEIILAYLFVLIFGGSVSYFVYTTGTSISTVNHRLTEQQLPLFNDISELEHWLNERERVLYEHYATEDKRNNIPKLNTARRNIAHYLSLLVKAFPKSPAIVQLLKLNNDIEARSTRIIQVLDENSQKKWDQVRSLLASVTQMGLNAQPLINELKRVIANEIADSNRHSNKQLSLMSYLVLAFSLVVLLIALLVGYYVTRMIQTSYEKRRFALFIEKSPIAIASISWKGELEFVNIAWRKEYPKVLSSRFYQTIKKRLLEFKSSDSNFCQWYLLESGNDLQIAFHKVAKIDQVMVYVENVSERVKAQKELEFIAYNDPLTGLSNVKKLEIDLNKELAKGADNQFFLLTIGMKRLKLVSTTHGYSVSDALLKALVLRLQEVISPIHIQFDLCRLYRFTGAKFCLLLAGPNTAIPINSFIEQVNGYLNDAMSQPLKTLFGKFFLDFQTGMVIHPKHGLSSDLLTKNANVALAEAQKHNRKNLLIFDQSISLNEQRWYNLENDLRSANFDQEFFLLYQPKIMLSDQSVNSMEALIRWNHPTRGLISPLEFIPVAEEGGVIFSLGRWVMRQAIKQTKIWHQQGLKDLQVAVNVSPSELLSADFIKEIKSALNEFDLASKFLEIEITEEVLVQDHTRCVLILEEIKAFGVSIALDDFGTGYSSLAYLNKFPLSKLKIDRSFITNLDQESKNQCIVEAIIGLSHGLGFKVIAEGIETQQELQLLQQLNCDQGQGYYFSKPLSVDDFSAKYLTIASQ